MVASFQDCLINGSESGSTALNVKLLQADGYKVFLQLNFKIAWNNCYVQGDDGQTWYASRRDDSGRKVDTFFSDQYLKFDDIVKNDTKYKSMVSIKF